MSRSGKKSNGVPVSLFPFLAVLLCTMGALVVVLVAMAHLSSEKVLAEATSAPPHIPDPVAEQPAPRPQNGREQLEQLEAAIKELENKREEADQRLQDSHLELAQIESHIQRLSDRLAAKKAAIAELMAEESRHYDDRAQAERNLRQLEELIASTKKEIEEAKEEQAGRGKVYSIVPYKGRNGTRRRPIYIECTSDHVVLQPEGVRLLPDDFRPPLGVSNPLAAALRATRDHYARQDPAAAYDPDAEPYPLIVVRTGGVKNYYRVRAAISSWDSDFGYELVSEDWDLKFPPPDPVLHDNQTLAVEHSRVRRTLLAQAAPRAYGGRGSGGIGSEGAGSGGGRRGGRGGVGQPYDRGMFGSAPEGGPQSNAALGGGHGSASEADGIADPLGGGPVGFADSSGRPTKPGSYTPSGGKGEGAPQRSAFGGSEPGGSPTALTGASGATQPSRGTGSQRQQSGGPASSGPTASTSSNSSMREGSSNDSFRENQQGDALTSINSPAQREQEDDRGADWAVDKQAHNDIAIRRPVRVVVRRDRLVVLGAEASSSDSAEARGATVLLDGPTRGGIDAFVSEVKKQVRSWGMAGRGLYWKPVLRLSVAPDGAQRARDLTRLLRNSGVDVTVNQTAARPTDGGVGAKR